MYFSGHQQEAQFTIWMLLPTLQNYAEELKKSLGEGVLLNPCDHVTHRDSFSNYKILLFPHTQLYRFSRLGSLGIFLLFFLTINHRGFLLILIRD